MAAPQVQHQNEGTKYQIRPAATYPGGETGYSDDSEVDEHVVASCQKGGCGERPGTGTETGQNQGTDEVNHHGPARRNEEGERIGGARVREFSHDLPDGGQGREQNN